MMKGGIAARSSVFIILLMVFLLCGCGTAETSITTNNTVPIDISQSPDATLSPSPSAAFQPENQLAFEYFNLAAFLESVGEYAPAYIFMMTDTQSPLPDRWAYYTPFAPERQEKTIEDVDFSKDFVLFVSMGYRSVTGPKITVKRIWQDNETVYVEANFDEGGPTYLPTTSEPTDIAKVSKEKMTQYGEISFILLDQDGKERARTTGEISSAEASYNPNTSTPPDNELAFEVLYIPLNMKEADVPTQIHIIVRNNSLLPNVITGIPAESQLEFDSVDYSNNFILFVFTGKQNFGAPSSGVTQIWQIDNVIYIQANFPRQTSMTVQPGFFYGNYVIKVSKEKMTQYGEITLILLDQDGKGRATITCDIPK